MLLHLQIRDLSGGGLHLLGHQACVLRHLDPPSLPIMGLHRPPADQVATRCMVGNDFIAIPLHRDVCCTGHLTSDIGQ